MSKRHNTASQAIANFYSKEDCLLPPPGEHASEEYLNKLRQLCLQVIDFSLIFFHLLTVKTNQRRNICCRMFALVERIDGEL